MSALCFCNSSEEDDLACLCYESEEEPDEEENIDDNTDEHETEIGSERVGIDDVPFSVAMNYSNTAITGNSANSKTNKANNGNGEIENCDNVSKDYKTIDLGNGDLLNTIHGPHSKHSISLENVHQNPSHSLMSSKVQNLNEQTSNGLKNYSTSDRLENMHGCSTLNKKQTHLNEAKEGTNPYCSTEYEWQFQETDGSWVSYDNINTNEGLKLTFRIHSTVSKDINRYCSSRVTPFPMAFRKNNHRCVIDFQSMTEHDQDEGTERPIRRVPKMAPGNRVRRKRVELCSAPPSCWSPMPDDTHLITEPLNTFSAEYKKLVLLIKKSNFYIKVIQITRIQHIEHYQAYEKRKASQKLAFPDVHFKEELLFHGTKSENVESICQENFNRNYFGRANGHKHGQGVYFTSDVFTAAAHSTCPNKIMWRQCCCGCDDPLSGSPPSAWPPLNFPPPVTVSPPSCPAPPSRAAGPFPEPSASVIFIVKVFIGRYIQGYPDSQVPSGDKCVLLYDTTVDNVKDPKTFVKYNSEEYYPEYFVEFKYILDGEGLADP